MPGARGRAVHGRIGIEDAAPVGIERLRAFCMWQHLKEIFAEAGIEARKSLEKCALQLGAALDDLGTPEALGRSPLGVLPGVAQGSGSAAANLRAVLVDVISELAASSQPRDAEAGRLLLDYYVKKVGSHEVIMERLHLSRPTFYRRLQRGFQLVAERIDEMSEFAGTVPVAR